MAEMSLLRRRMIEDMTIRNLSPTTQRSYLRSLPAEPYEFSEWRTCRVGIIITSRSPPIITACLTASPAPRSTGG
jgi:hypothetical protein